MVNRVIPYALVLALLLVPAMTAGAAPTLEAIPQKYAALPGEFYPVDYKVSWPGDAGAYTVLPPVLPEVPWGEAVLLEVRSRKQGDINETRLVVGFRAAEPGDYEAPALDVRVLEWAGTPSPTVETIAPETPALVLTAAPLTVAVRKSRVPALVLAVIVTLLLLGMALVWAARRRTGDRSDAPRLTPAEQGRALLHEARRHRLDGDYYAFYRTLRRACDLAARISDNPDTALCTRLDERIDDTGYRGRRPSEDDLEGDFKDVEQLVARLNAHP